MLGSIINKDFFFGCVNKMKVNHVVFFAIIITQLQRPLAVLRPALDNIMTIIVDNWGSHQHYKFEQRIHCQLEHVVFPMTSSDIKVVVNGDPLYRTHCCP